MYLQIITPEKKVFEGEVRLVTLPGTDGSFQLLDRHAPLVSLLKGGMVTYKTADTTAQVAITGGVVETLQNKTVLLADGLEE